MGLLWGQVVHKHNWGELTHLRFVGWTTKYINYRHVSDWENAELLPGSRWSTQLTESLRAMFFSQRPHWSSRSSEISNGLWWWHYPWRIRHGMPYMVCHLPSIKTPVLLAYIPYDWILWVIDDCRNSICEFVNRRISWDYANDSTMWSICPETVQKLQYFFLPKQAVRRPET